MKFIKQFGGLTVPLAAASSTAAGQAIAAEKMLVISSWVPPVTLP